MGLHVGDRLHPASKPDTDGHYEDLDFLSFQQRILQENGLPYTVSKEQKIELKPSDYEKAHDLINRKSTNDQWGWKDPRTCLFLPFWDEILKGHEVYHLFITRNEDQVLQSLFDRAKKSAHGSLRKNILSLRKWKERLRFDLKPGALFDEYEESIAHHVQLIDDYCNTHPSSNWIKLKYETLIHEEENIYRTLTENWGFDLNKVNLRSFFK